MKKIYVFVDDRVLAESGLQPLKILIAEQAKLAYKL
jgi:hypothetical protein